MVMKSLIEEKKIQAVVRLIEWERIFLHMDVEIVYAADADKNSPLDFYIVDDMYDSPARMQLIRHEGNRYHLRLNMTNSGENVCVPSGNYRIYVCQNDVKMADCEIDPKIVRDMGNCSRNFFYNNGKKVYAVNFYVEEGSDTLPLRMQILAAAQTVMQFPKTNHFRDKIHPIQDIKSTWLAKRNVLRKMYAGFVRLNRAKRNHTILFMTEQNKVIASNLKAVSERMKERGLDNDYQILFSAREAAAGSQSIKSWIQLMEKLAKSGTVVLDDHAPCLDWLQLTSDTKVLQLWHAGAGFKSSGYSRWGHQGCPDAVSCHRQYDYGIAGSKNIAHFFSEVWGMNDELVLPTGMPRMDEYLNAGYRAKKTEELYKKYEFCKGKKVMLFAPTYRGRGKKTAMYPYDLIDFKGLYEACGKDWVVLFKMHPWVADSVPIPEEYKDKFKDVGKYPNINDLFYITDLLITDYSSNIFEYSLMKKPMMFFAFDKIQYAFSRGFHRPYEESAPGKVCSTFNELLKAFREEDYEFEKVEEYVRYHFDHIDSNASDRVIDWLILGNIPKEIQEDITRREKDNAHRKTLDFLPEGYRRNRELGIVEEVE